MKYITTKSTQCRSNSSLPAKLYGGLRNIPLNLCRIRCQRVMAADAGWVLYRWLIKIDRLPKLGETITVQTWASSFERFYGNREFIVLDGRDNPIVKASSVWIYFNIKKETYENPLEMGDAYGIDETRALEEPFTDFDLILNPKLLKNLL